MEVKDIILLIAGALIGLFTNYFTNYTSAPLAQKYRTWRDKRAQERAMRSVEEAGERIRSLTKELQFVTNLRKDSTNLLTYSFINIALLGGIVITLITVALFFQMFAFNSDKAAIQLPGIILKLIEISLFIFFFGMVLTGLIVVGIFVERMQKVRDYTEHDEQTRKQISELTEIVDKHISNK